MKFNFDLGLAATAMAAAIVVATPAMAFRDGGGFGGGGFHGGFGGGGLHGGFGGGGRLADFEDPERLDHCLAWNKSDGSGVFPSGSAVVPR